jgi:hypothetical protein
VHSCTQKRIPHVLRYAGRAEVMTMATVELNPLRHGVVATAAVWAEGGPMRMGLSIATVIGLAGWSGCGPKGIIWLEEGDRLGLTCPPSVSPADAAPPADAGAPTETAVTAACHVVALDQNGGIVDAAHVDVSLTSWGEPLDGVSLVPDVGCRSVSPVDLRCVQPSEGTAQFKVTSSAAALPGTDVRVTARSQGIMTSASIRFESLPPNALLRFSPTVITVKPLVTSEARCSRGCDEVVRSVPFSVGLVAQDLQPVALNFIPLVELVLLKNDSLGRAGFALNGDCQGELHSALRVPLSSLSAQSAVQTVCFDGQGGAFEIFGRLAGSSGNAEEASMAVTVSPQPSIVAIERAPVDKFAARISVSDCTRNALSGVLLRVTTNSEAGLQSRSMSTDSAGSTDIVELQSGTTGSMSVSVQVVDTGDSCVVEVSQ